MIKMTKIKKIMMSASLGVSVVLLSACGGSDKNPMLEKGVPEYLAQYIQHPFMFYDGEKRCVAYFSVIKKDKSLKEKCERWMKNEYNSYSQDLPYMRKGPPAKNEVLPSSSPSFEEFQDIKVWKIVNNIINGK